MLQIMITCNFMTLTNAQTLNLIILGLQSVNVVGATPLLLPAAVNYFLAPRVLAPVHFSSLLILRSNCCFLSFLLLKPQDNRRRGGRGKSQRQPREHVEAVGALRWSCGVLPETFGYNQSHLWQGRWCIPHILGPWLESHRHQVETPCDWFCTIFVNNHFKVRCVIFGLIRDFYFGKSLINCP